MPIEDANLQPNETTLRFTLKRKAMLKHSNDIDCLFKKGKKFSTDYLRVTYKIEKNTNNAEPIRLFFAAPKKYLRHAIQRNTTKRRMREATRQNLTEIKQLCTEKNLQLDIAIVYQTNIINDYSAIEQLIVLSLQKIFSDLCEK